MATRQRKAKPKTGSKTDDLLRALRFVALAQSPHGTITQTHCVIHSNWIAATDNVMTLGAKVPDDLTACPQTKRLIAALEKAGSDVTITQQDADRLRVVSGPLRVSVPCVALSDMAISWADPLVAPLDDRFLAGLRAIGHIASETGTDIQTGSVLCTGQLMAATNREVLAEYWHGLETPPYWVLPAATVDALLRIDSRKLVGIGYSGRSVTFHFEDESWLKSQLYEDNWKNAAKVWEGSQGATMEVPPTFFEAMKTLDAFTDSGFVSLEKGVIKNINKLVDAAEIEVPGLPEGLPALKIKNALLLKEIAKTMLYSGGRAIFFFGENVRMAIAIFVHKEKETYDGPNDAPF